MNSRKIGLLIINGPLPPPYGGIATYLAYALPYLAKHGFEVHTLTDQKPKDSQAHLVFENQGVHIHYSRLTRVMKVLKAFKYLPFCISLIRNSHLPVLDLLKTLASMIGWLEAGEAVLRTQEIDIIHAYDYPWVQGYVAAHLARKHRKEFLLTTFGEVVPHKEELVHHDEFGKRFEKLSWFVLKQADTVVSLSEHCAKEVERVGISQEKVRIMYWGVDTSLYHPGIDGSAVEQELRFQGSPIVLFIGQVRLRKGPQVLVEASAAIVRRFSKVKVVIAGPDYGIVDQLKTRASGLGVSDNILFLGEMPHRKLLELYALCDVFVFPTCTPIECLGLSMIQAMSCAKPVVGSRINGIPEVIADGETGWLVEPGDPKDLAEKIVSLLENRHLGESMGRAARQRAVNRFEQSSSVSQLEKLYRTLV